MGREGDAARGAAGEDGESEGRAAPLAWPLDLDFLFGIVAKRCGERSRSDLGGSSPVRSKSLAELAPVSGHS